MTTTMTADVLQDDLAMMLARALALANKHARELGIDVRNSLITITQLPLNGGLWRIDYGPKDYIGRRGGDLIIEVDPVNATIKRVLRGQ